MFAGVDGNGVFRSTSSTGIEDTQRPQEMILHPNYPNPFNPSTTIGYRLPASGRTTLKVYNLLGQEVRTLVDGPQMAGGYEVVWDGKDATGRAVPSGVYLCRLAVGNRVQTNKMTFLK
jgi:hypothetical protein